MKQACKILAVLVCVSFLMPFRVSGEDHLAPRSAFTVDRQRVEESGENFLSDGDIARIIDDITSADPELSRGARLLAIGHAERIVPGLIKLLDSEQPVRRRAAVSLLSEILDTISDSEILLIVERRCEGLSLGDADSDVRMQATLLMGKLRIARTKTALTRTLLESPHPAQRKAAAMSLSEHEGEAVVRALADAFRTETDISVRIVIAESLSRFGGVHSLECIVSALKAPDFLRRHDAIESLGAIAKRLSSGDLRQTAEQLLIKTLSVDSNPYVRGASARALGGLSDSRDLGAIFRALSDSLKDDNAFVHMSAVRSMNAIRTAIVQRAESGEKLSGKTRAAVSGEQRVEDPVPYGEKEKDGAGGTGQIGKEVSVVRVQDNLAVVRLPGGKLQSIALEHVRRLEMREVVDIVRQMPMRDEDARCTLLCLLGLIDDASIDLCTFEAIGDGLFGFASSEKRLIALQEGVAQEPIALIHELCEFLAADGVMAISADKGDLVMRGTMGKVIGRIALMTDDARRQLSKADENPAQMQHYLLRAFARQVFGDHDRMFTMLIKSLGEAGGTADAAAGRAASVADSAVPWVAAREVIDAYSQIASGNEGGAAGEAAAALGDVVLYPGAPRERAAYAMEALLDVLASRAPGAQRAAVKELGRVSYVATWMFNDAVMARICGARAVEADKQMREEEFTRLIEPLFFKRPDLFGQPVLRRVASTYGGTDPLARYLAYYAAVRGMPVPDGMSRGFSYQGRFRDIMGAGLKKVLIVHNLDDGFGDELIRVNTLLEGLLHYNPQIRADVYTRRPFLYRHPRVTARDIRQFDPSADEKHDMVVDYFSIHGAVDENVEESVQDYVYRARPSIMAYAGASMWDFSFQGVFIGSSPVQMPYDRSENAYTPILRLCAELGISFRSGTQRPRESLLLVTDNAAGERYWNTIVERARGGRPVAAFNGLGGEAEDKGFSRKPEDQLKFVAAVRALIARGLFVVLLPNESAWGSYDHLVAVVKQLPPADLAQVLVAPPLAQNRDIVNYAVSRSDLVVTTEGGQMHFAYGLGKPMVVFRMPGTASMTDWVPLGTDPCQIAVNADSLIGAGVDRVLLALQAKPGVAAGEAPLTDATLHSLEAADVSL